MKTTTLWTLTGSPEAVRSVAEHDRFEAVAYSLMKHGDSDAIQLLGSALGRSLLVEHADLLLADAVPVFPVAYLAVPPACWYLSAAALAVVNEARVTRGLLPGRLVHVRKDSVTATDYASSSAEQRAAELSAIGFQVGESLAGCLAVVIDDVRVTGSAEATIAAAVSAVHPDAQLAAYVAVCDPVLAAAPHVERILNHVAVTSPLDLLPAIEADRFCLTIRFLKFALGSADLAQFVRQCPQPVLLAMYDGALATGAAFTDAYAPGMATLRAALGDFRYALARLHAGDQGLPAEGKNAEGKNAEGKNVVSATAYSRFKHGSSAVAEQFAQELAHQYAEHHDLTAIERLWVTGSGYAQVPPAATALVPPFVAALTEFVPGLDARPLRVHRSGRSPGDYAAMSPADRDAALRDDCMYADPDVDLHGELVVALDDIRVTGTHERAMNACLSAAGARWIDHLYLVDAAAFASVPQMESVLNLVAVAHVEDLLTIVCAADFEPNARVCRRVLTLPPAELGMLFERAPGGVLQWIDWAVEADRLAGIEQFADGVRRLKSLSAPVDRGSGNPERHMST